MPKIGPKEAAARVARETTAKPKLTGLLNRSFTTAPIGDGVALTSSAHPKGPGLKRGRPTKEVTARRAAAVETVEIDLPYSKEEIERAVTAYRKKRDHQRELMRKRRAKAKEAT